jgi:hypothetical protein
MTSPDHQPLPRDPGSVPASLRDAYTLAEESQRAAAPLPHPGDAETDMLLDDAADDLARLSIVDQMLGSRQGVETLAHLVAARLSTADPATPDSHDAGTTASTVPLAFAASPAAARRRRVNSMLKPVLLAASLMMVAGTSWYVFTLPQGADDVRALGTVVELHGVTGAAQSSPLTLAWKPLPTVSRYRVEILDANDDPVFTTETNDTTAVVPPRSLKAGTYRWWVRSRATDGVEIRSRVEKLTIR